MLTMWMNPATRRDRRPARHGQDLGNPVRKELSYPDPPALLRLR